MAQSKIHLIITEGNTRQVAQTISKLAEFGLLVEVVEGEKSIDEKSLDIVDRYKVTAEKTGGVLYGSATYQQLDSIHRQVSIHINEKGAEFGRTRHRPAILPLKI